MVLRNFCVHHSFPRILSCIVRSHSSANNRKMTERVSLDGKIEVKILENKLKPKHHPGKIKLSCVNLPDLLLERLQLLSDSEGMPIQSFFPDMKEFLDSLRYRRPPNRNKEIRAEAKKLYEEYLENLFSPDVTNEESQSSEEAAKAYVIAKLKSKFYHWKPLKFSKADCFKYLYFRMPPEYAVLRQIMSEIKMRNPSFKPNNLFDFGSGVGSSVWAAKETWNDRVKEYFLVDSNPNMLDISAKLLNDGINAGNPAARGIFFRQFLPSSCDIQYDIVVCAYSVLELPDEVSRLQVIQNLWDKTNKFLIIVDYSSYPVFETIVEARDFLLRYDHSSVFSPCPHEKLCPRVSRPGKNACKLSAHFTVPRYMSRQHLAVSEPYSYVVMEKGPQKEAHKWPRIVEPVITKPKHVICRLCCPNGDIQEQIITKYKNGRELYQCAKYSNLGDFLPVDILQQNT